MTSESFTYSTIAVPAVLGPTARAWSGGLTSPTPPVSGEFAAPLMAAVMPSKPCAPLTLPANFARHVRAPDTARLLDLGAAP